MHFLHMMDPQRRQWCLLLRMLNLFPQSGQNGTSESFTHDTTDFSMALKKTITKTCIFKKTKQAAVHAHKSLVDKPRILAASEPTLSNDVSWTAHECTELKSASESAKVWRQQAVLRNITLLKAHLFQSDDQFVDFDDVVVYPGSTMLFKVLYMTSGCSWKEWDKRQLISVKGSPTMAIKLNNKTSFTRGSVPT